MLPITLRCLGIILVAVGHLGCVYIGANQVGENRSLSDEEWVRIQAGEQQVYVKAFLQGDMESTGVKWIFLYERDQLPNQLSVIFKTPEELPVKKLELTCVEISHTGLVREEYCALGQGTSRTETFYFNDMSKWNSPSHYKVHITFPSIVRRRSDFDLHLKGNILFKDHAESFSETLSIDSHEDWYITPAFLAQPMRNAFGHETDD